ncbi:hypothetical protein DM50_3670 [Burkholderia mallei]|nr:hypothetical protein DM75_3364 [Burkholderia mallei]KOS85349.1 hypothetical protein DM45_2885 [Burkholderia mallei]KOT02976.1 hypothetical protein DM50_3670 [Burkholderia mallei]
MTPASIVVAGTVARGALCVEAMAEVSPNVVVV